VREAFVYFKHEEQGLGPAFAAQLINSLNLPQATAYGGAPVEGAGKGSEVR
jgi:hypothetical protein